MSDPAATALTQARTLLERAAAERARNPRSPVRKDVLKRLISLTKSPHPAVKSFVAQNLRSFFKDFPALQDEVIDCVYDLCEDTTQDVRVAGYRAIVELSREQPKWTKRNTDVLLQLLQSDDPVELGIITQALVDHVQIEAPAALAVLCDHCVDEGPLRKLVIDLFLTQPDVLRVLRGPNDAAEQVFVDGLRKVLPKVQPVDAALIIDKLLLPLQTFSQKDNKRNELLDSLTAPMRESVRADQALPVPWTYPTSLPLLEMVANVPTTAVVRFFKDTVLAQHNVIRMEPTIQLKIISIYFDMLFNRGASLADKNNSLDNSLPVLHALNNCTSGPDKLLWDTVEQIAMELEQRPTPIPAALKPILEQLMTRAESEPRNLAGAALRCLRSALQSGTPSTSHTTRKRKSLDFPDIDSPPRSANPTLPRAAGVRGIFDAAMAHASSPANVGRGGFASPTNGADTSDWRAHKRAKLAAPEAKPKLPLAARMVGVPPASTITRPKTAPPTLFDRLSGAGTTPTSGPTPTPTPSKSLSARLSVGAGLNGRLGPAAGRSGVTNGRGGSANARPGAANGRPVAGQRRASLQARIAPKSLADRIGSGSASDAMDVDNGSSRPTLTLAQRMKVGAR